MRCGRSKKEDDLKESSYIRFHPGRLNPAAPPETEQLGRLVGIWDAEQIKRNRDGSWSDEKSHAEWRWYYILDGHAVQDDWLGVEITEDSRKVLNFIGTNIRIYNPEEEQWHMAWIDKTNRRLAGFTAIYNENRVIMTGTNAQGRLVRTTFYHITPDSFNWKQEWTFDDGKSWLEVAKIHCIRRR
jgi:hypothetical protein